MLYSENLITILMYVQKFYWREVDEMKNIFNKQTLAQIGVLDEFYDLYMELGDIYFQKHLEMLEKGIHLFQLRKYAISAVKKAVDKFLEDKAYLFTDEYKYIHPNNETINALNFLEYKHGPLNKSAFKITIKAESFEAFIEEMYELATVIIYSRVLREKPRANIEYITHKVNDQFKKIIEQNTPKKLTHTNISPLVEVIVFKSLTNISCNINEHTVINDRIEVSLIESKETVSLPVHRCIDCGRVFIGNETLKEYQKMYGKMLITAREESICNNELYGVFGESQLHRAGYNVVEGKTSQEQRRCLLDKLIESGSMSEFEICRDIINAINIFKNRIGYEKAVSKWREDLMYVTAR